MRKNARVQEWKYDFFPSERYTYQNDGDIQTYTIRVWFNDRNYIMQDYLAESHHSGDCAFEIKWQSSETHPLKWYGFHIKGLNASSNARFYKSLALLKTAEKDDAFRNGTKAFVRWLNKHAQRVVYAHDRTRFKLIPRKYKNKMREYAARYEIKRGVKNYPFD